MAGCPTNHGAVIARSAFCDEAIPYSRIGDCFASLAMTHAEAFSNTL
jgi:hypothetical protein